MSTLYDQLRARIAKIQTQGNKHKIWETCAAISLWTGTFSLGMIALFVLIVGYAIFFGNSSQAQWAWYMLFFLGTPCAVIGIVTGLPGYFLSVKKKQDAFWGIVRNSLLVLLNVTLFWLLLLAMSHWLSWRDRHPDPSTPPEAILSVDQ